MNHAGAEPAFKASRDCAARSDSAADDRRPCAPNSDAAGQMDLGLPPVRPPRPISPEFIVDARAPMLKRHKQLSKNARNLYLTMRALADGATGQLMIGERWLSAREIEFHAEMGRDVRMRSMKELIAAGLVTFERERMSRRIGGRTRQVRGRSRYTVHKSAIAPNCEAAGPAGPQESFLLQSISSTVEEIDSQVLPKPPLESRDGCSGPRFPLPESPPRPGPRTACTPRSIPEKIESAKNVLVNECGLDPELVEIAVAQVDATREAYETVPRRVSYYVVGVKNNLAEPDELAAYRAIIAARKREGVAIAAPLRVHEIRVAAKTRFIHGAVEDADSLGRRAVDIAIERMARAGVDAR
jgi:hypothetical protein